MNPTYPSYSLLSGTINPGKVFFSFLAKFGFQKTEILNKDATQGYIYGNITYHHGASNQTNAVESFDQVSKILILLCIGLLMKWLV